jgi:uncharacterized membrane protein YgcG
MARNKLKIVLPLIVIVVGIAAAALLASSSKAPARVERPALGPLVEVTSVARVDVPVVVTGHGQVGAKVAVDVVPQVAGKVVKVHPSLVAGCFAGGRSGGSGTSPARAGAGRGGGGATGVGGNQPR